MELDFTSASRRALPAVMMRGGTSKGLVIHRKDLPDDERDWAPTLISAMGSHYGDARQIDGVGAASTVTSKVAVVSRSSRPDAHVDFTFVQVVVGEQKIDMTGTCGNMAAAVGPFAVEEGIIDDAVQQSRSGQTTEMEIRIFNTNTNKIIVETIELGPDRRFKEEGDFTISGVKGSGSRIKVAFEDPAGSMTGSLFPSGQRHETISINEEKEPVSENDQSDSISGSARVTLIDAGNPWVLVDGTSFSPSSLYQSSSLTPQFLSLLELIRRKAAVLMGLAKTTDQAAQTRGTPKIAIVNPRLGNNETGSSPPANSPKVDVQGFSAGKLHPSLHITGALCVGISAFVPRTIVHGMTTNSSSQNHQAKATSADIGPPNGEQCVHLAVENQQGQHHEIVVAHPSGTMDLSVDLTFPQGMGDGDEIVKVKSASLFRTARRLFEGKVYYLLPTT